MKKSKNQMKYFLYFSLVIIGFIIGIATRHYYNMPIAETINIVDLATLVVTILLAVYIPSVLDQKLQIKRDKKELIEKRVDELQALYRKVNLAVQGDMPLSSKEMSMIKNALDIAEHKVDLIGRLLSYSKMDISFDSYIQNLKKLDTEHQTLLWHEDTDTPFTYSDEVVAKEEILYNELDEVSSLLIFKISDA